MGSRKQEFDIETEKYVDLGLNAEKARKYYDQYYYSGISSTMYGLMLENELNVQNEYIKNEEKAKRDGPFSMQRLLASEDLREKHKRPTLIKPKNRKKPKLNVSQVPHSPQAEPYEPGREYYQEEQEYYVGPSDGSDSFDEKLGYSDDDSFGEKVGYSDDDVHTDESDDDESDDTELVEFLGMNTSDTDRIPRKIQYLP